MQLCVLGASVLNVFFRSGICLNMIFLIFLIDMIDILSIIPIILKSCSDKCDVRCETVRHKTFRHKTVRHKTVRHKTVRHKTFRHKTLSVQLCVSSV